LHKLILSYNNLTSIEDDAVGRLEMLTILHLDHNKLTQIPPGLPSSLIKLYMHNNLIMELHSNDLMSLINLQVLDLSHNRIIYMPQLTLPTLITLSVKACGLENVNLLLFKTCPSLRLIEIDGNLIKCAQLMEIEQCTDDDGDISSNKNNNINDDIVDDNTDDVERKERHLNSISYFPNDGGHRKCNGTKSNATTKSISPETVPNCWNEQNKKLITSFIRTNESTVEHTATAANDNKLQRNVAKGKNDGNLSSETMSSSSSSSSSSGNKVEEIRQLVTKAPKLAHSVDVVRVKEIKALKNNVSNGNKSLSLAQNNGVDAEHKPNGLNNLILMKTKQFKSENGTVIQLSYNNNNYNNNYHAATTVINRNSIDNGGASERQQQQRANAIKDNGKLNNISNNNKSKSIVESSNNGANGPSLGSDATDHQHTTINQSTRERWNDIRVEGSNISNHPGLLIVFVSTIGVLFTFIVVYVYRCNFINSARRRGGRLNGSCENINEGRDVLNDNFNEEIHSFTIETHSSINNNNNNNDDDDDDQVAVNYRSSGIGGGGGIYTNRTAGNLLTATSIVNHCDLLPMDILNSTLSHSQASHVDNSNISMHLW
jgi:Leucine rich repeat